MQEVSFEMRVRNLLYIIYFFFIILSVRQSVSYIVQAGLELEAVLLCLTIARITGICHYIQLYHFFYLKILFSF